MFVNGTNADGKSRVLGFFIRGDKRCTYLLVYVGFDNGNLMQKQRQLAVYIGPSHMLLKSVVIKYKSN